MAVSVEELQIYELDIRHDVKDNNGRVHNAWIVCGRFTRLVFIKDTQYLQDDTTLQAFRNSKKGSQYQFRKSDVCWDSFDFQMTLHSIYEDSTKYW